MNIVFEFKSDEEKADVISTIGLTVQPISDQEDVILSALKQALQRVVADLYVKGSVTKMAREKQSEFQSQVAQLFAE